MIISNHVDQKRLDRLGEKFADLINQENATLAEVLSVCVATIASVLSLVNCRGCRESAARQTQAHLADVAVRVINEGPQELGKHHQPNHLH